MRASPFAALGLDERIVRAFVEEGYEEPTPIQRAVIEPALDERDVLACAQTGTGKTAGFVAPILQNLISEERGREIRALILAPTRELAAQIGERIQVYGAHLRIRHVVIYGGVGQHQQEIALRSGPEILVATPGRLLDLMNQRLVDLSGLRHFVLDEADRMLDMGFIHDVRRVIAALPRDRQTMLFSATIPPSVATLAQGMLFDPVRVSITPAVTTAVGVTQSVLFVSRDRKRAALEELLLRDRSIAQAIVFTRTKHGANRLAEQLSRAGIGALAIHGNKSQGARVRALGSFRDGSTRVLVATDLAARGIDVDGLSHVINYELPNVPESYVHRIGRTGRAGADGIAISFCDEGERDLLADIERFIRRRIPRLEPSAPARATSPVGPR
ncbi:MAG: DEAD/DEAH box helicase [Polyangiaceae bacterium]|nr:DEAD/DEAH box helicase [Polyangiaceae bacterium]